MAHEEMRGGQYRHADEHEQQRGLKALPHAVDDPHREPAERGGPRERR